MADSTIVFSLDLNNSNERREWSYLELVQNHLLEHGTAPVEHELDANSSMTEEKKLAEIAKSLEKKYGTMVTMTKKGKRKRVRIDDFLDPGEGYDTQDSFIDDSEAVDVFVAPNVSTKHGGFYVFEGLLEGLEDEDAKIETPPSVKQAMSGVLSRQPPKKNKSRELLEKAVKRLSASKPNSLQPRNKMLKLDSVLDSVLSVEPESTQNGVNPLEEKSSILGDSLSKEEKSSNGIESAKPSEEKSVVVPPTPPLPNGLSEDVLGCIANLLKADKTVGNVRRGMSKQFETELLNLSSCLEKSNVSQRVRSTVFAHIEGSLQLKRKALTRRLKKLTEASEDHKLKQLLDELSDAIAKTMPALLDGYIRDKAAHNERLKQWQAENADSVEQSPSNGDQTNTKRTPRPGAPKKLFRWNNECRMPFQSVIKLRLENHKNFNIKVPPEEYVRSIFPTLIKLWPEGWISNAALWRAAQPIFQKFTSPIVPTSSSDASDSQNTGNTSVGNTPKSSTVVPPSSQSGCKVPSTPDGLHISVTPIKNLPSSNLVYTSSCERPTPVAAMTKAVMPPPKFNSSSSSASVTHSTPIRTSNNLPQNVSVSPHPQHSSIRPTPSDSAAKLSVTVSADSMVKSNVRLSTPSSKSPPKLNVTRAPSLCVTSQATPAIVQPTGASRLVQGATTSVSVALSSVVSALQMNPAGLINMISSKPPSALSGQVVDSRTSSDLRPQVLLSTRETLESNLSRATSPQLHKPSGQPQNVRVPSGAPMQQGIPTSLSQKLVSNSNYYQPFAARTSAVGQPSPWRQQQSNSSGLTNLIRGLSNNGSTPNGAVLRHCQPPPAHQHNLNNRPQLRDLHLNASIHGTHLGSTTTVWAMGTAPKSVRNNEEHERKF